VIVLYYIIDKILKCINCFYIMRKIKILFNIIRIVKKGNPKKIFNVHVFIFILDIYRLISLKLLFIN